MVFMYWFGPRRNVALFSRTPSMSTRTWLPTRPRRNGEPPPSFMLLHPAAAAVLQGLGQRAVGALAERALRDHRRRARHLGGGSSGAGHRHDRRLRRRAARPAPARREGWLPAVRCQSRPARGETRAPSRARSPVPDGRPDTRAMPLLSVTVLASWPSTSTRAPPMGAPEAARDSHLDLRSALRPDLRQRIETLRAAQQTGNHEQRSHQSFQCPRSR